MGEGARARPIRACSATPAARAAGRAADAGRSRRPRADPGWCGENVAAGGIRLARLLDDALGPEAKAPGQRRP